MKTRAKGRKTRGPNKARSAARRAPRRKPSRAEADEKANRSMQSFELV